MKLLLLILTAVFCVSPVQAKPDELARSIAERLLEDEEIWSQGDERLTEEDRAFFMHRADATASALADGARGLAEEDQRRYIENALDGPEGVRARLRAEIREFALTGTKPAGAIDAPPSSGGGLSFEAPDPQTLIIGLVALAAIVPLVMVFFSRRGRARS
jgi:hypothetical protein